ncbi:hypothetical protein SVAN01_08424 [Stagonosporopsis vannaccii]|nr:hypothetical protein SVAN01_08424 [Stagonosporopsis vannaccii]
MCMQRAPGTGASGHEDAQLPPACSLERDRRRGSDRATFLQSPRLTSPDVLDRQTLPLCYPSPSARLPKMASSGLVEAFARLSTSASRLDALEALIQELTPYEWRFVQSRTGTRTFQFDIIGRLPVELVSHIFSYLDTTTPWRLQHVSRSWHQNLRSLAVLQPSLDRWYNGTVDFQKVDLAFCWHKARSIHAFRSASQSALPDCSFKILAPFMLLQNTLCGDHLIWLAQHRRSVQVLNLRTLTSKALIPASRELLRSIDASDGLVTVTAESGGVVYVGELTGLAPLKKFRFITSSPNFAITRRRRTVACTATQSDGLLVYIWDYDTERGRSFTVRSDTPITVREHLGFPASIDAAGLLLQPDTQTIVLCLLVQSQSKSHVNGFCTQLFHCQFTFSGNCLHGARLVLDGQGHDPNLVQVVKTLRFTAANHDGLFMLHCNSWAWGDDTRTICTLQFDEKLHTLTRPPHPRLHSTNRNEQGNIVWWQDTFIEAGTKDRIIVHRGTVSDPRNGSIVAYDHVQPMSRSQEDQGAVSRQLLINDRYMVRPYCGAFYVYCFDHTVHLPGKEGILDGVGRWKVIEPKFANVSDCIAAMHNM